MRRNFTNQHRVQVHQSTLDFSDFGFSIRFEVKSRYSKQYRRQILLMLFRAVKPVLSEFGSATLDHSDSSLREMIRNMYRPVSLHQAMGLSDNPSREGLQIRMKRLSHRLTQAEFSKVCGISRAHLSTIEHGKQTMSPKVRAQIEHGIRMLKRADKIEQLPRENKEREGGGRE